MAILETKNLTYTYGAGTPFEKTAVENVNLSVEKGAFVGVIGHTGSGKSTLIQMLNGLIRPTSGQVLLNGEDIWAKPKEIRRVRFQVGMVFQYPEYQLFEETVIKDIMFGPKNMGLSDEEALKRAKEAAHFTDLKPELLEKSPFELSGGEKRRAAIAGVIAMDPEVLILDEPAAGLDPKGRDVILAQISEYHRQRGNTILLVSHSMEDIGRVADRVLVMNNAHAEMYDETRAVFSRGELLEPMGLRLPQITSIMRRLRKMGLPVSETVLNVDEAVMELLPLLKKRKRRTKTMLSDVTMGQFFPGKSVMHRLDPRIKMCLTVYFIVLIFCSKNFVTLGATILMSLLGVVLSKVPLKLYLKSMKPILFIVVFTGVLNLFYGTGDPIFTLGFIHITRNGIVNSIMIAVRIVVLILISSILTFTTSPTQLTDAIERLLKPLALLHVPVHEFAMMMTIALRFVPTLLEETEKIMAAQKARGADMESGGLMQRIKALIPVLIPLFVSAFRRAFDLATAMESRCYHGGEGRTKMKVLHLSKVDYITLIVCVLYLAAFITVNILLPAAIVR